MSTRKKVSHPCHPSQITSAPLGEIFVSYGRASDQPKKFKFDKVFGERNNQDEVYAECQPLIRSVLDGEFVEQESLD